MGAGSSISHSNELFPSIDNFFSIANNHRQLKDYHLDQVADYANDVLGKNLKTKNVKVNIEDLLTHIDIVIEKSNDPKLLSIRQELLTFIRRLLIKLSIQVNNKNGDYDEFISSIKKSDTIINFNWDFLLDNLLGREIILHDFGTGNNYSGHEHYKDFVYNYSAIAEGTVGYPFKQPNAQWNPKIGYYIKVHGSIDWFYCGNEACGAYRKVFPVLDLEHDLFCSYCHEQLHCMIIPPILNKGYKQYPLIRTLWNLAAKELSLADEIIIWGYSLPPTDFYAKWLLRQARQQPLAKLTIINPEVINIPKKGNNTLGIIFIKRFYDLYRDVMPKESLLLYKNYKDYIDGQHIFKKYLKGRSIADHRSL